MERSRSRRDTIRAIIAREPVERCGFWLGNPDAGTWPLLHRHFGTQTEEELRQLLGDDVRWICPQFYADAYQEPQGRQPFDTGLDRHEAILPNVPMENVAALADAAAKIWKEQ